MSRHSRNTVGIKKYELVIVSSLILFAFFLGGIALTSYQVSDSIWEVNTGLYGAAIPNANPSLYIDITTGQKPPTYPTVDMGTIVIHPAPGSSPAIWSSHGSSDVRFSITAIYPTDANGNPTADGNPVSAYKYDAQGLTWNEYYFQYEVQFATASHDGNDAPIDAEIYVGTHLNTEFTNDSYKTQFVGATIVNVITDTTTSQDLKYLTGTAMPGTSDVAPKVQPYQAAGQQLGNLITKGMEDDRWYITQFGGYLTPGIGYTYFGPFPTGINFHIDVRIKYTVRFSILVSKPTPPVQQQGTEKQTLDNYADKHGTVAAFLLGLFSLSNLLFIVGVIVVILIFWKVLPAYLNSRGARRSK